MWGVTVRKLPRLSMTRAVLLVALLVVGYFIFSAAGDTLLSHRLNQDGQRLQSEVADLHRQQGQLQAIRDYLKTDEYVEGVGRRILGLVRPGERLVIVSSSVQPTPIPTPGASKEDTRPWWEKLYGP